jgi:microcystin-dependent protein
MATVSENLGFVAGIYQLENADPVEGGALGVSNRQARELASRTKWLKDQLEAMAWRTGDVKEVACTEAYITANFSNTGLGLANGERSGWAICNGQNGTIDKGGRVGVGRGGSYTMGQSGGNKDAVVVSHTHAMAAHSHGIKTHSSDSGNTSGWTQGGSFENPVLVSQTELGGGGNTNSTGVSGTDKNMQPYVVTLFIQKL